MLNTPRFGIWPLIHYYYYLRATNKSNERSALLSLTPQIGLAGILLDDASRKIGLNSDIIYKSRALKLTKRRSSCSTLQQYSRWATAKR